MNNPVSIGLVIIGLVLLIVGIASTDSVGNSFSRLFAGTFTDRTLLLIIGGAVLLVVGAFGWNRNRRN